jgi:hypothetical protein
MAQIAEGTRDGAAELAQFDTRCLWKLPEPWTPRTRPPLLGNSQTEFPQLPQGLLLFSLPTSIREGYKIAEEQRYAARATRSCCRCCALLCAPLLLGDLCDL